MTIQTKLKLIGLIPLALLLALASYFFVDAYHNYTRANDLKIVTDNNTFIAKALVELGKERSVVALYLGAKKKEYNKPLQIQIKETNKAFDALRTHLNMHLSDNEVVAQYQHMLKAMKHIENLRKEMQNNSNDFKYIFLEGYTHALANPLQTSYLEINRYNLNADISPLISTLSHVTTTKANSDLERGFSAYYVAGKAPMQADDLSRWIAYKNKAYGFDQEINKNNKNKSLFIALEKLSGDILAHVQDGHYNISLIDWFTLQTEKIDLYSHMEAIVAKTLKHHSHTFSKKQFWIFIVAGAIWLLTLILLILGYTISRDIHRNIKKYHPESAKIMTASSASDSDTKKDKTTSPTDHDTDQNTIHPSSKSKKVLIYNNHSLSAMIQQRMLEREGYECVVVNSEIEFLDRLESGAFRYAIMKENHLPKDDCYTIDAITKTGVEEIFYFSDTKAEDACNHTAHFTNLEELKQKLKAKGDAE